MPILQDRAVEDLLSANLKPLRNEPVSHFLEKELGPRLDDHAFDELCFVYGQGKSQGQTYYQMADMLAMRAFTGNTASTKEFLDPAGDLMRRTTDLAIQFLDASDRLIGEGLVSMGCRMERGIPGSGAQAVSRAV